jgi:chromate transporter
MPRSTSHSFPSFALALRFWIKLGLISFGGPAGQIAIMHKELVERKQWMDERHFLNGLNFCMLLPGPEAQQLATYLGWRLHGLWGGLAAGSLFVLPSALIIFALSWLYIAGDSLPWVGAVFYGVLGAVIAIILDAVLRIGGKALRTHSLILLATLAFVAIFFFNLSFVLIVLGAGILGLVGHRLLPRQFPSPKSHSADGSPAENAAVKLPPVPPQTTGRICRVLLLTLVLWWTPVVFLGSTLGWSSTPAQQGLFFSKAALVTFGGAYAVLPYVAQQAVETHQWLDHTQMMAGLALAESTPGPLIMVLQFVGFVGGWQHPGDFLPWQTALLCSAITTWVTFLPCFLFVFLGAPWIEKIGNMPNLAAGLSAITASVVGVILNLGIKFAGAALWSETAGLDLFVAGMAVAGFLALRVGKLSLPLVLAASAGAGLLHSILVV